VTIPGVSATPTASIVIPTRGRAGYLDVALSSIEHQASAAGAEIIVVEDGEDPETRGVAARHGTRLVSLDARSGANAARNAGITAARSELLVFVDDDIEASSGWLERLLGAARSASDYDAFGGPIRPRLEGRGPRGCGREPPPITNLDLGDDDRDVALVWSANMAIRRAAFERVGAFDETIRGRGEEEEWQRRLTASGGRIRYVGGAAVVHRRAGADARMAALARADYALGHSARRYDVRKHSAPSLAGELRLLAGAVWHTLRRRCGFGPVMIAHALGRLRELAAERTR